MLKKLRSWFRLLDLELQFFGREPYDVAGNARLAKQIDALILERGGIGLFGRVSQVSR